MYIDYVRPLNFVLGETYYFFFYITLQSPKKRPSYPSNVVRAILIDFKLRTYTGKPRVLR